MSEEARIAEVPAVAEHGRGQNLQGLEGADAVLRKLLTELPRTSVALVEEQLDGPTKPRRISSEVVKVHC